MSPAPQAVESIRECLAAFSAARRDNAELLDETKLKEIAVIEMLENRAEGVWQLSRAASPARDDLGGADDNPAYPEPLFDSLLEDFWTSSALPEFSNPGMSGDWSGGPTLDWDQLASLFDTSIPKA